MWKEPKPITRKFNPQKGWLNLADYIWGLGCLAACLWLAFQKSPHFPTFFTAGGVWLLFKYLQSVPKTYMIAPEGLRVETGISRDWYCWNAIEYYRVETTPILAPQIACVSFKVKTRKGLAWPQFYFDSQEIDEAKLRDVLEQHLPGKELKRDKIEI